MLRPGLFIIDDRGGSWDVGNLTGGKGIALLLQRFPDLAQVVWLGGDLHNAVFINGEVVGPCVKTVFHDLVLAEGALLNDQHPFLGKHEGDTASLAQIAAEFVKIMADIPGGAVAAVSYTHLRAHETLRHLVCRLLLEKIFFLMIRRPPRSTPIKSSAASDVYKRQPLFRGKGGREGRADPPPDDGL